MYIFLTQVGRDQHILELEYNLYNPRSLLFGQSTQVVITAAQLCVSLILAFSCIAEGWEMCP